MASMTQPILPLLIGLTVGLISSVARANDHAELFARLDADSNGQLTQDEIPPSEVTLFKRLLRLADHDKDHQLTAVEFEKGLSSNRPQKPLPEKVDNKLLGSDALILLLTQMDPNGDRVIKAGEVPANLRLLFDEFVDLLNLPDRKQFRVAQLRQQAIRYTGMAHRFALREGIDVDTELVLLSDKQWAYSEQLRSSFYPGERITDPANLMNLFTELDSDGDGNVTADEVPEPLAERFTGLLSRADTNQDKQLSEQEFRAFSERIAQLAAKRHPKAETRRRVNELLERFDENGDGLLSQSECPPRLADRFAKVDRNGDDVLDRQELSRAAEIIATLRNSAGFRPTSASSLGESTNKNSEK